ncbi:MAG TPA: pyridoxamine 5'-phosphate oxidase family protein [Burkholderiales bacterium]|nr:pyridoxamine 5'-phosphate oxidase family protein [Burkholderiales bacterium]
MTHRFARIAFTESVKAAQERRGSRATYERLEARGETPDELGPVEAEFIALRDSFYMATVSETGWPYVQHRGGPPGFLKVLGPRTLGFADFRGNVQYVTLGNVNKNDRIALILMDYANRRRLKILGRMRAVEAGEADAELLRRVESADYRARVERVMLIEVEAFDWNCPQHITPRYTEAEVEERTAPLKARIEELERRLRDLQDEARR